MKNAIKILVLLPILFGIVACSEAPKAVENVVNTAAAVMDSTAIKAAAMKDTAISKVDTAVSKVGNMMDAAKEKAKEWKEAAKKVTTH